MAAGGNIAYLAHIGGFLAGLALLFVFRPKKAAAAARPRGPWG